MTLWWMTYFQAHIYYSVLNFYISNKGMDSMAYNYDIPAYDLEMTY